MSKVSGFTVAAAQIASARGDVGAGRAAYRRVLGFPAVR